MNIRDVDFDEAFDMVSHLEPMQYKEEFGLFLDKCLDYLGKVSVILEIGSHYGASLALFGGLLNGNSDDLLISISIGYWVNGEYSDGVKTEEVKKLVEPSTVIYLNGYSNSADIMQSLKDILNGRLIDILFIDANHSYEGSMYDYKTYVDFCKPKSIIGFHDIYYGIGVHQTFEELKQNYISEECVAKSIGEYKPEWERTNIGIGILYKGGGLL